jgi:hypothetical protein
MAKFYVIHNTKKGDAFVETPPRFASSAADAAVRAEAEYPDEGGVAFETVDGTGVYIRSDSLAYVETISEDKVSFEEENDE